MPGPTLKPYEFQCEAIECLRPSRTICVHNIRPYFHPECYEAEFNDSWMGRVGRPEAQNRTSFNPNVPLPANPHSPSNYPEVPLPPIEP